jgi:single-strand DNA-binding protein
MASYNRVILMGHLTRDPELRNLPNTTVCDFALAVNRQWKDSGGEIREEVLFIDCSAFGRTGETIHENLTKGRPIHVDGRLKLDQWEQDDGQRRSKIRVVVEQFRFVDRKPGSASRNGTSQSAGRTGRGKARTGGTNGKGNRSRQTAPAEPVGAGVDETPF